MKGIAVSVVHEVLLEHIAEPFHATIVRQLLEVPCYTSGTQIMEMEVIA